MKSKQLRMSKVRKVAGKIGRGLKTAGIFALGSLLVAGLILTPKEVVAKNTKSKEKAGPVAESKPVPKSKMRWIEVIEYFIRPIYKPVKLDIKTELLITREKDAKLYKVKFIMSEEQKKALEKAGGIKEYRWILYERPGVKGRYPSDIVYLEGLRDRAKRMKDAENGQNDFHSYVRLDRPVPNKKGWYMIFRVKKDKEGKRIEPTGDEKAEESIGEARYEGIELFEVKMKNPEDQKKITNITTINNIPTTPYTIDVNRQRVMVISMVPRLVISENEYYMRYRRGKREVYFKIDSSDKPEGERWKKWDER